MIFIYGYLEKERKRDDLQNEQVVDISVYKNKINTLVLSKRSLVG
jgi:hypothetical protein